MCHFGAKLRGIRPGNPASSPRSNAGPGWPRRAGAIDDGAIKSAGLPPDCVAWRIDISGWRCRFDPTAIRGAISGAAGGWRTFGRRGQQQAHGSPAHRADRAKCIQPVRQFVRRRLMISAEIAVREDVPSSSGSSRPARSNRFRNVAASLESKDPPHQRDVAGASAVAEMPLGRAAVRHARNRERDLIGARAVCSRCPIAIPRSGRLSVRGGRKAPAKIAAPARNARAVGRRESV